MRDGWGDSLSTRELFEMRDCHPTPPLISFASTLPLQGRVTMDLIRRRAAERIEKTTQVLNRTIGGGVAIG